MEVKNGFLTSEFWVSFVGAVLSLLVLGGVIGPEDSNNLLVLGKDVVAGVVALLAIVNYARGRVALKDTALKTEALKVVAPSVTPDNVSDVVSNTLG